MNASCTIHAIMGIVGVILFFLAAVGTLSHKLISLKKVPPEIQNFQDAAQNVRYQTNIFYLILGLVLYFITFITGLLVGSTPGQSLSIYKYKIIFTLLILFLLLAGSVIFAILHFKKNKSRDFILKLIIIIGFILTFLNIAVINFTGSSSHRFFF